MKTFHLEIQTPQKKFYSDEVGYLQASGTDGLFGVLADHAPMVAALGFGVLLVRMPGGEEKFFCTGEGLFEVEQNRAYVLVDTVEFCEDVDAARAEAARDRAEKRLKEHPENLDVERARAALFRALTRLRIAGKS